jgi:hypothetical protein
VDRRLHGSGGHARALYTELISNMSTRAKPEGGALAGLIERFVIDVHNELQGATDFEIFEQAMKKKLQPLLDLAHGVNFIRVLAKYVEGFSVGNDDLMNASTRWLRGEYGTKTEARQDLNVRDIIEDHHLYDMLKLWAKFVRLAGYGGLFVNFDELVVLSERLNNKTARVKNFEIVLQILNDCLQGYVGGLIEVEHPDWQMSVKSGSQDFDSLAKELTDAEKTLKELFKKHKIKNITQAEQINQQYQEVLNNVQTTEDALQVELGEDKYEEFQKEIKKIKLPQEVRPLAEIVKELTKLESQIEKNEEKTDKNMQKLKEFKKKYVQKDELLLKLANGVKSQKEYSSKIASLKPLPPIVKDIDNYIQKYEQYVQELEELKEQHSERREP